MHKRILFFVATFAFLFNLSGCEWLTNEGGPLADLKSPSEATYPNLAAERVASQQKEEARQRDAEWQVILQGGGRDTAMFDRAEAANVAGEMIGQEIANKQGGIKSNYGSLQVLSTDVETCGKDNHVIAGCIPTYELFIGTGKDCEGGGVPHWHAKEDKVPKNLDIPQKNTPDPAPNGCGYCKVSDEKCRVYLLYTYSLDNGELGYGVKPDASFQYAQQQ